jgi:uncharacterized membrane protein required for colicin V production
MLSSLSGWNSLLVLIATLFVVFQVVKGWRQGVLRQAIALGALACAYGVALCAGKILLPLLRPFGYPDIVLSLAGGLGLAFSVFIGLQVLGMVLFPSARASQAGTHSRSHAAGGAAIGLVFGLFTVWVAIVAIRLLGTIAQSQTMQARHEAGVPQSSPSAVVSGLAEMKESLDQGATGAIVKRVDPVPSKVYTVLFKIAQVVSDPQKSDRLLAYPGAKGLTEHPKFVALRDDPSITQDLIDHKFLALLTNHNIVSMANDPELRGLFMKFEFEKALDYALAEDHKVAPASARN